VVNFEFVETSSHGSKPWIFDNRHYELIGLGKRWYSYSSFNEDVRDLENVREIQLILPELHMRDHVPRDKPAPYLSYRHPSGGGRFAINLKEDMDAMIRLFNALGRLRKFTVHVPMTMRYAENLLGPRTGMFDHFKLFLKPFKAFHKCEIDFKVEHGGDPSYELEDRYRQAWREVGTVARRN
jgi:hypothetical protein